MASNILSIGQSALSAAQVGMSTTGHNIANASTPGYNRQVVQQGSVAGQNLGYGFIGKGTEVTAVKRVYNEFLNTQVISANTNKSQLNTYHTQIQRINNMMADPATGLSPALQDFFSSVQDLTTDPSGAAARQSLLSSAEAMTGRFHSLSGQLAEMSQGVNDQIAASVSSINGYASQIASLNQAIEKAQAGGNGQTANDLLDQRDQAMADLSAEVRVNVIKQGESYHVFIGNGQPLVVNERAMPLQAIGSATDPKRMQVAYQGQGSLTPLPESVFAGGGALGALLDFRAHSLDATQNELGRIATVLGKTFNDQHRLGQDLDGNLGRDFFKVTPTQVSSSARNTGNAELTADISNAYALTGSDYRLQYAPDANSLDEHYLLVQLPDGTPERMSLATAGEKMGLQLDMTGTLGTGDEFLIRPTVNGAALLEVAIRNKNDIAAAVPVRTATGNGNIGTGTITAPTVDFTGNLPGGGNPAQPDVTLSYDAQSKTFSGFPPGATVTLTGSDGTNIISQNNGAIPYVDGAIIAVNGISFTISGKPADGDTFEIKANIGGTGDAGNMLALGNLQTSKLMDGHTSTYQGAYSRLVNTVGNKTRELEATSMAATKMHTQAVNAQQAQSGVNLDEEATNLLRYQQAYQAAAKMMQTANQMFDTLLSITR